MLPIKVEGPLVPVVVSVNASCFELNILQSVFVKYPLMLLVAAGIDTVPAVFTNGELNVNADCLLLNVNQSTLDKYPSKLLLDCCIDISGVAPPVENKGVVAVTDDTPAEIVQDLSADKL